MDNIINITKGIMTNPIPINSKKEEISFTKFEINLYTKYLKMYNNAILPLISLGQAYTRAGEYVKALMVDEVIVKVLPDDPISFYNLACSYAMLNKIKQAIKSLETAFKLGYEDFDYMKNDKDLDNLKNVDAYKNLLEKYKK